MTYYYDKYRHLVCMPYTIWNLHRMAESLGIKRCWYHNKEGEEHYDIPKKMMKTIGTRAKLVNRRVILLIIKKQLTEE